ncbi:MAG: MFS transporter [Spirochaetaceae bacterium]|nr:MAG: MFS transporter [Spirochaetaceae bacterium]
MVTGIRKKFDRIKNLNPDILFFLVALAFIGFSQGLVESTFNNFLKNTFSISDLERSMLELPRETPGFLTAFISALFFLFGPRRTAVLANLIAAIGILLIGIFSLDFSVMLVWLFIFSIGQHLFLPLNSSLGIDLAPAGKHGKRLGQFSGVLNLATILGSLVIFFGFMFLKLDFRVSYIIAAASYFLAACFLFIMKPDKPVPSHLKLKLKKEYKLYYWLTVLYGTRKQIFLTFAPWVIVKVYRQETTLVAMLLFIAGFTGIFFKPFLGRLIDKLGERFILASEAAVLVFVCLGYGFARTLFDDSTALILACICYVLDYLLMSVSMARATYLKKIATDPDEVAPTLSMATTIDHVFSIAIALLGGVLWAYLGFETVFLTGAIIAIVNFFSALRIRIPNRTENPEHSL